MIASVERLFTAPVPRDPLGVHRSSGEASGSDPAHLQPVLAALGDALVSARDLRCDLTRRMDVLEGRLKEISRQLQALGKVAA